MKTLERQRGFTLVELVVAMLIVGILAAIAVPSYSNYVRKSHRTDAKSALLDLAALEERYFTTQAAYTDDPTKLGYTGTSGVTFLIGSGYYNVLVSRGLAVAPTSGTDAGTPASYVIKATAVGNQTKDTQCYVMQVDSTGAQKSTDASSVDTTTTGGCWN